MKAIRYVLRAVVGWLDRKFPDRLTPEQVDGRMKAVEARLESLERFVPQVRVEIAKCKMLVGVEQLTSVD